MVFIYFNMKGGEKMLNLLFCKDINKNIITQKGNSKSNEPVIRTVEVFSVIPTVSEGGNLECGDSCTCS